MEQPELGLEEALLSNDNRNKFFHHSGSGKGSGILRGKKIIPPVNLPNSAARGRPAHGISAKADASSPVWKGKCPHSKQTPLQH